MWPAADYDSKVEHHRSQYTAAKNYKKDAKEFFTPPRIRVAGDIAVTVS